MAEKTIMTGRDTLVMCQRERWTRLLLAALLLVAVWVCISGCVYHIKMPVFPNQIKLVSVSGAAEVRVVFYDVDRGTVPYVLDAVRAGLRGTKAWGYMSTPLTVRVFPTHRSLEESVLREYDWLRAWALFEQVYLQSPRTWKIKYYRSALTELLKHELTHVVMYQRCCTLANWQGQAIPFWFREGMASVTADQGRRRWSVERLGLFGRTKEGQAILRYPERYLARYQPVAYSVAHWMFARLLKKWRRAGVKKLLWLMKQGRSFKAAFKEVTGMSTTQFRILFDKSLREAVQVSTVSSKRRLPRASLPMGPLPVEVASGCGGGGHVHHPTFDAHSLLRGAPSLPLSKRGSQARPLHQ